MLEVRDLTVSYGAADAVRGISFELGVGRPMALIGPNGAGKSSTLRAISRLVRCGGEVRFDGVDLSGLRPDVVARMGLMHVPEGRRVFATLTVEENLLLGRIGRRPAGEGFSLDEVYDLFPALTHLRSRFGWSLSGGEQQMVAIGRALVANPRLLLLDEPSLGLAPAVVDTVFAALAAIAPRVAMLVVEQNTSRALTVCTHAIVLVQGRCVLSGPAEEVGDRDRLLNSYLGLSDLAPGTTSEGST